MGLVTKVLSLKDEIIQLQNSIINITRNNNTKLEYEDIMEEYNDNLVVKFNCFQRS